MTDTANLAFQVTQQAEVAVVTFDLPNDPVNTLDASVMAELTRLLDRLAADPTVRALVLRSGKPESFIVGAKIDFLATLQSAAEAESVSRQAQAVILRVEQFPKPVVVAIHGNCLGGGLELALGCHYRIASDAPQTQLGLPEVQLGLIPGGGGTQRLPRRVGIRVGLDLILTGKSVRPSRALALHLVDEVVPAPILDAIALRRGQELASGDRVLPSLAQTRADWRERLKHLPTQDELAELALEDNPLGRKILFEQARRKTLSKTRGNYPAPLKALEAVRIGMEQGEAVGYLAEAKAFGEVAMSEVSHRMVELFFATAALKKDRGVENAQVKRRQLTKIGIVGGGFMGAGIAYVTAQNARLPVRVKDTEIKRAAAALAHTRQVLDERVKKKTLSRREAEVVISRVTSSQTLEGFSRASVVIEAVFEDLALKHRVLQEVEAVTGKECIFASNTSSLPLARIAEASKRPHTVAGMHYFSPVHKMPLLEVVTHPGTADWVTATCVDLGKRQGKTPIVVRDSPGFYTSRILTAYLNEACHLITEGADIAALDGALEQFGFPVGPVQLLDEVGFDVAGNVATLLHTAFGDRMPPAPIVPRLREDGRLGRKNRRGFYTYDHKKKQVDDSVYAFVPAETKRVQHDRQEMAERVALQMVNEAIRCLGENVLRQPRDGDVGAILGLGFPPYLGGPFRYADARGSRALLERLRALEQRWGPRFTPAPLLVEKALRNETFHASQPGAASRQSRQKRD